MSEKDLEHLQSHFSQTVNEFVKDNNERKPTLKLDIYQTAEKYCIQTFPDINVSISHK